jgi:hypothetical protein
MQDLAVISKIEFLIESWFVELEEANRSTKSGYGRSSKFGTTTPARKKLADSIRYSRAVGEAFKKRSPKEANRARNEARAKSQLTDPNFQLLHANEAKKTKEFKDHKGRGNPMNTIQKADKVISSYIPGVH